MEKKRRAVLSSGYPCDPWLALLHHCQFGFLGDECALAGLEANLDLAQGAVTRYLDDAAAAMDFVLDDHAFAVLSRRRRGLGDARVSLQLQYGRRFKAGFVPRLTRPLHAVPPEVHPPARPGAAGGQVDFLDALLG